MDSSQLPVPELVRREANGVVSWVDSKLEADHGVLVAFSERQGGVSTGPYTALNLAGHVGDDALAVAENRRRFLDALGIARYYDGLTLAEQIHGAESVVVDASTSGSGSAPGTGTPPIAGADALLTSLAAVPLLLCFADCVPVVLVAPGPAVCVVHAGWRGALAGLPAEGARRLIELAGCSAPELVAYIGPHICPRHYEVGPDVMSQFVETFGTVSRAHAGGLNLDAVVRRSLSDAGVPQWRISSLGACTAEETDRFFSYRAEQGMTGRHGALACILP